METQKTEDWTAELGELNPSILPCDVNKHEHENCVIVTIPKIYVNTDDLNGKDKVIPNLRMIEYAKLSETIQYGLKIINATKDELVDITTELITILGVQLKHANLKNLVDFIGSNAQISRDLDIDDEYIDNTLVDLSFDVIRRYVTDEKTGILCDVQDCTIYGYQLYSQITNDADLQYIRHELNDSDYNRMQYILAIFEKMLLYNPDYLLNSTSKITALAVFYLCLVGYSNPIEGYCANDIKANLLGFIIDNLFRTRLIQAWFQNPISNNFMSDLKRSYNQNNYMVQLCVLPTAKLRAEKFIRLLHQTPELQQVAQVVNYDKYIELLDAYKLESNGVFYYNFDISFISNMITILPNFDVYKNLINDDGMLAMKENLKKNGLNIF